MNSLKRFAPRVQFPRRDRIWYKFCALCLAVEITHTYTDRAADHVTRQSSDHPESFSRPSAAAGFRVPRAGGEHDPCARALTDNSVSDGARAEQSTDQTWGMIAYSANDICCSLHLSTSKKCVRPLASPYHPRSSKACMEHARPITPLSSPRARSRHICAT